MQRYYCIEDFNQTHIGLYENCFHNPMWLNLYGFNESNFDFDNFIETSVLQDYPFVDRWVVLNNNSETIFFAHLCTENNYSVIVGGLIPELINSGQGILCSLIIFDLAFKTKRINSIDVSILKTNKPSLKMVNKLGFIKTGKEEDKKASLSLKREDYPNSFAQNILSRIKYDKI